MCSGERGGVLLQLAEVLVQAHGFRRIGHCVVALPVCKAGIKPCSSGVVESKVRVPPKLRVPNAREACEVVITWLEARGDLMLRIPLFRIYNSCKLQRI